MKHLIPLLFLLPGCAVALADTCVPPARFGKRPTEEFPAVGRLVVPGGGMCTASLVTETLILTVAHCIEETRTTPYAYFRLDDGTEAWVKEWGSDRMLTGLTDGVAVAELYTPITHVAPLDVSSAPLRAWDSYTMVGYGCARICLGPKRAVREGSGIKRKAVFPAAGFRYKNYRSDLFWICFGDSGGPVISMETGRIVALVANIQYQGSGQDLRFTGMGFVDPRPLGVAGL